jgi:hypothetical protein
LAHTEVNYDLEILHAEDLLRADLVDLLRLSVHQHGKCSAAVGGEESDINFCGVDHWSRGTRCGWKEGNGACGGKNATPAVDKVQEVKKIRKNGSLLGVFAVEGSLNECRGRDAGSNVMCVLV